MRKLKHGWALHQRPCTACHKELSHGLVVCTGISDHYEMSSIAILFVVPGPCRATSVSPGTHTVVVLQGARQHKRLRDWVLKRCISQMLLAWRALCMLSWRPCSRTIEVRYCQQSDMESNAVVLRPDPAAVCLCMLLRMHMMSYKNAGVV